MLQINKNSDVKLYVRAERLPTDGSTRILFDYNFLSEEYPEYVGSLFNDRFSVKVICPDGTEQTIFTTDINSALFQPIEGLNFPSGDETVGATGWLSASADVPFWNIGVGEYEFIAEVTDAGDDIYDTWAIIDNIRFE